ncbi:DUF1127 domain-containing protein [Shimia thalassica]|uniref:DUF1127 domain-containing protein n=1 Tax=Shimia thalassica TaxID=1715693 RepID=UPI002732C5AB|nr:DUF1127 domain-containing protein [Shimia thalassica]MDP2519569.1 DUF1127 domain-containing protein [Shimia thalassica]
MADTSIHFPARDSALRILAAPFFAFGKMLVTLAEANGRVKEAEAYQAMTDAELAERGLRREDIAMHVFKDSLYI